MKAKVKFVLLCHIVIFYSYSLAVDMKQKITTSTPKLETPKRGFYSGRLPWLDGPFEDKTENQTSDFPPELWVMVLKSMQTFSDLTNAILGKVRFETALDAPKIFIKLGCEDLNLLHNEIANNPEEAQQHFKSTLSIYKKFLTSKIYEDATFVLLWKLASMLSDTMVDDRAEYFTETDRLVEISELAIPYVRRNIEKKKAVTQVELDKYKKRKENFVKYAEHISLLEHSLIPNTVMWRLPYQITGWMYAGYALILEHSKHLENRVPCVVMEDFVEMFSGGNGQYILLINSPEWTLNETSSGSEWTKDIKKVPAKTNESKDKHSKSSDELQLKNRFEINWKFLKGNLTDEDKHQFILFNSEGLIFSLLKYHIEFGHENQEKILYAFVISALNDLIVNQIPKNKLVQNLAMFDLAKDDPFIEKCRKWLLKKFEGSKMLETGLEDQMAIMDVFQSRNGLSVVDAYNAVIDSKIGEQNIKGEEYFRGLLDSFGPRCDPDHAQNFTNIIKMIKIALYTWTANFDVIYRIQRIVVSSMQNPHLINNLSEEFFEMDELHTILMERNADNMFDQVEKDDDTVKNNWRDLFRKTYDVANANSIFHDNQHETNKDRKKRRFFLKLLWQLSMCAFHKVEFIDESDFNRITQIQKLVYRLAKNDDMSETSLIRNCELLKTWFFQFTMESHDDIQWEFTQEDNEDFNFVYKPFNGTGASDKNPIVFLCIVNSLVFRQMYRFELHDQLMKNYITVEANIRDSAEFDGSVRPTIMYTTILFHFKYVDTFKPCKYLSLKGFIDSIINLLLCLRIDRIPQEYDIADTINLAVSQSGLSGDKLKSKLGKESIELLDQYHQRLYVNDAEMFDEELRGSYEKVKELLGYELIEPNQGQSNTA